jgi:[protein-PII] uridylyltransferase
MIADLSALRLGLRQSRRTVIAQFRERPRPDPLLIGLRRSTDQALCALVKQRPLPTGAALAAVGGYGRGELYPYSDVDLLILLRHEPSNKEQAAIESLVASLWDLGLEPAHSVRTIEDCQHEAQDDITVETALLESRWLAGSRTLFAQFMAAMRAKLDARKFFLAKYVEMRQRHARYQDTPYALEPNCKESPGGLRDLQVILWMARAAGLGNNWREVVQAGLLTRAEARDLRRAEQAFKRLRIELHLLANRSEDRVLFDLQPALAEVYGLQDHVHRRASELLMQRYYWAARLVTQLNTILVQNIEARLFPQPTTEARAIDNDFRNLQGRLDIIRDDGFERNPTLLLRAFLVMQQHVELTGMSARTLRAMWHSRHRIDAKFRRTPINRQLFLQILQQPQGVVHALRRMTMLNILPRYLPVFRRIVGQMQHDLFHGYTVDEHTLTVVRNLRRFTLTEYAHEHPLAHQLIAGLERHWLLYVAALFHDIAKGRGGNHAELGAQDVRRFARQHGLNGADTDFVEFLVRQHLLMSTVAQKHDLSDPNVVREFAAVVKTERRLTALYLFTVADIRGTSPKVWNAWKGKLLEDLYHLALTVLDGAHSDVKTVLVDRKEEAARLTRLAGLHDDAREAFWAQLDLAYFLRHDAGDIAWHTGHLSHQMACHEAVVKARAIEQGEGLQIMVYRHDKPDSFMTTCAYFDAKLVSIQEARLHTTRHGWALDSFVVLLPPGHSDARVHAALIEHELAQYLKNPRAAAPAWFAARTKYQRLHPSRVSRVFPLIPEAELRPHEDGKSWWLSVVVTDRHGLLHALARVFAQHAVNLRMAKIMTLGDRVEDVFIIEGVALDQPRTQMQFERDIRNALTGTVAGPQAAP